MTIYNINFGIGWASSGVEYAQMYRAKLLRDFDEPLKFVFLDFMSADNIQTLTDNMGFKDEEIIWLYQYFTDIKIAPTTYTIDAIKANVYETIVREEQKGKVRWLHLQDKGSFITCYLKNEDAPYVDCAEFVINGKLVRKDYYSYTRIFSEYYAPEDNKAKRYMRHFYNEDGSVAYSEYIDGETNVYVLQDAILYTKEAFVAYFMRKLNLTSNDIVIYDRASKVGQAMLQNKGDSKVGVVVHAEHFSENATDDDYILWNNYYEYQFSQANEIDFFITATERQTAILRAQFKKYLNYEPKIFTIPVGSLEQLCLPDEKRHPYSMMTASRLASEKHIDWLVRAAAIAKKQVPELTFDIYGEGGERKEIAKWIEKLDATDYIRLLGHQKLDEVYKKYPLFVAASTSEGFGLTLMEAVGSGLGMIGFDVNYGNPTFIRDGENGYLIPIDENEDGRDKVIERLADAMIAFFNNGPASPHEISYKIAESFLKENTQQKWKALVEEVLYG
ncbi:TPA: accessory Sec system glycosyltransferase GtfA [Staphylococcus delphini]|nr:accessory Sec system glycosyltransferase GtfA [Staphylococcus delphini]HEC2149285.1 accessory Sec system glycosyltransferase GtfA [Staphylococcus delphini]HEC2150682.1 accessory Sec system glycosyltransferase GtfA [Staphylococcus delphini]HEC2161060.1 accessory Sec system glycosyltransferase GtfA [Staphylococcus delphini]HEC2169154.1 accessory Sec system glycosyltransferase GtfA [Staphylococcus delphini]